jgi:tetratricopeptide (TPR) repeat protein
VICALAFALLLPAQTQSAAHPALTSQIEALAKAGNWNAIADLFETLAPAERVTCLWQGLQAMERSRRWAQVLKVCTEPLPGSVVIPSHFKGRALSELGRHAEALAWDMDAGKRGDMSAYLAAANEASALSDWKAYQACAEAMSERYPTKAEYIGMRGEALARQARYLEAEESLNEAIHLDPKRAMSWADLACCFNEQARYPEAFQAGEHAVALDPRLLEGLCNRGRACIGLKRYQEGRDDYAAALALGPSDPALVANLKLNISMADKFLAYQAAKAGKRAGAKP